MDYMSSFIVFFSLAEVTGDREEWVRRAARHFHLQAGNCNLTTPNLPSSGYSQFRGWSLYTVLGKGTSLLGSN